jgi:hypothetical protein
MNCDDYLSLLETLPVEDLAHGRPREHADGCLDCERVTRVVAEHERNMIMAFEDVRVPVPAAQTAARALVASRRRKVAVTYNIGLGLATAATVLYVMLSRFSPAPRQGPMVSETFRLQCLSPAQAAEVLRPYIQPTGLMSFRPSSPLGVIHVEAPLVTMTVVRSILERYDTPSRSQCAVQVIVPHVP